MRDARNLFVSKLLSTTASIRPASEQGFERFGGSSFLFPTHHESALSLGACPGAQVTVKGAGVLLEP